MVAKKQTKYAIALKLVVALLCVQSFFTSFSFAQEEPICVPTEWPLWAGQHNNVGTVSVINDQTNVTVTVSLDTETYPEATFYGVIALWIGNDAALSLLPTNPNGHPIPGQFKNVYGGFHFPTSEEQKTYTFEIPFSEVAIVDLDPNESCDENLNIYVHANVNLPWGNETAWGGDNESTSQGAWYFHGDYTICCEDPLEPPQGILQCNTSFSRPGSRDYNGKDYGYVFSETANPDNFYVLENLHNNGNGKSQRWGWASHLYGAGTYHQEIWASAGRNDLSKGEQVGNAIIEWNGSHIVTVEYLMDPGVELRAAHVYASSQEPWTHAPGQYGYTWESNPGAPFHFVGLQVVGNEIDGIWTIVHGVACYPEAGVL